MNEKSWLRVLNSRSENQKSKSGLADANLKSLCMSVSVFVLALSAIVAHAQQPRVPRIGLLVASTAAVQEPRLKALKAGLRELGYVEGKNIIFEGRYADGKPDQLSGLAGELQRSNVDIILAIGGTPPAQAAKKATRTVPIIMANVADAVGDGLVVSLARPGSNITGLSTFAPELSGKRLELLKELVPGISRVAVLASQDFQGYGAQIKEVEAAAHALGLQLQQSELHGADDLKHAFAAIVNSRSGALMTLSDPVTFSLLKRVVELAVKSRIPSIHLQEEFANAGGLISYGPSYTNLFRRAATYIDKILKCAKPGDLPVEQPTKFEFVINLQTAKKIGLTIPPNVLARADKVIR